MVLLLGGSGYVGSAYQAYFQRRKIAFRNIRRAEVDYAQRDNLVALLKEIKPEFLLNAAGYTGKPNVDACEIHKTECLFGNAVLPGIIQQACELTQTPWGHVSSGCIYSGDKGGDFHNPQGFTEDDKPNFSFRQNYCSFYSGSKALGEEILADAQACYIWRLRIPFNEVDNPRNYLTKLMRYETLFDARNSLSQLEEFVHATWSCWEKRVPFGIYNVTNPGSVTTREVVDMIQASGVCDKKFKFFTDEKEFMTQAAKTPRSNCVMDTQKLQRCGIIMRPVKEALQQALKDWKA